MTSSQTAVVTVFINAGGVVAGNVDDARAMGLIRWVDTWKKLALLVALVFFAGLGKYAWESRREVAYVMMNAFGTPRIHEESVGPEITRLMADTGAVTAAVWSMNLEKNQRIALYVRERERVLENLNGTGDLILRPYSDLTIEFINLIDSKAACWKHVASTSVGKSARESGVKWVCASAIPPQFGQMIGMLAIGFTERPGNEDYVKLRIKQAAVKIIE